MAVEYFHVVTFEASGRPHLFLSNLSERDLKARFLRPRRRGAKELVGDRVIDFGTLDEVTIVQTVLPKDEALSAFDRARNKKADEFNSEADDDSGLHWIPMPISDEDIVDIGKDVTSRYIKEAPGEASRQWQWTLKILGWWGSSLR